MDPARDGPPTGLRNGLGIALQQHRRIIDVAHQGHALASIDDSRLQLNLRLEVVAIEAGPSEVLHTVGRIAAAVQHRGAA